MEELSLLTLTPFVCSGSCSKNSLVALDIRIGARLTLVTDLPCQFPHFFILAFPRPHPDQKSTYGTNLKWIIGDVGRETSRNKLPLCSILSSHSHSYTSQNSERQNLYDWLLLSSSSALHQPRNSMVRAQIKSTLSMRSEFRFEMTVVYSFYH